MQLENLPSEINESLLKYNEQLRSSGEIPDMSTEAENATFNALPLFVRTHLFVSVGSACTLILATLRP